MHIAPDAEKQNIGALIDAAVAGIRSLESKFNRLIDDVVDLESTLDAQRSNVQRQREECDILYSLESGDTHLAEDPTADDLRNHELALTDELLALESLRAGLSDFRSILLRTITQFNDSQTFLDEDAATQLMIKTAQIRAREEERRRFAREIHDGPAQAFANAIIGLEFVERAMRVDRSSDSSAALDEIERIKVTMREGLTEIRRFIFDNRPTMLQDRGLESTIKHYVASYQSIFPTTVDLHVSGNLPRLNQEQELTAFRVIQESIQNANRHAKATRIVVDISATVDAVTISISDNGRGFIPERVRSHLTGRTGLSSMQERAQLVGGKLTIISSPGEGSTITLTIPISDSKRQFG